MQKENAIQVLNSRKLITEPGKFQVKVTNVTPYQRPENNLLTNIVSYAAMTPYQLGEARRLMTEGIAFEKEGNVEEAERLFQLATNQNLASSQRVGLDFTPAKGELVNIVLDYIPTKADPTINALLIASCSEIKAKSTSNVNFSFEETEEEVSMVSPEEGKAENIQNSTDPTKTKTAKEASLVVDEAAAQV